MPWFFNRSKIISLYSKPLKKIIPNEAFFAVLLGVVFPYLVIIIELIFRHIACGWVTSLKDPLPEICIKQIQENRIV